MKKYPSATIQSKKDSLGSYYSKSNRKTKSNKLDIGPIRFTADPDFYQPCEFGYMIYNIRSKDGREEDNEFKLRIINNYIVDFKALQRRSNIDSIKQPSCQLSDFECTNVILGEGYFGTVELYQKLGTKEKFAFKVIKKSKIPDEKTLNQIINEIKILRTLDHPLIIRLFDKFQDDRKLYLQTEFVEGGDLHKLMKREKVLSEKSIKFILAQIFLVLEYLHSHYILYRDIKPENILIDGNGYIKLADFGISKYLSYSDKQTTKTFCGTPEFIPPEILKAEEYGMPVDMWSFGILAYELYFNKVSF